MPANWKKQWLRKAVWSVPHGGSAGCVLPRLRAWTASFPAPRLICVHVAAPVCCLRSSPQEEDWEGTSPAPAGHRRTCMHPSACILYAGAQLPWPQLLLRQLGNTVYRKWEPWFCRAKGSVEMRDSHWVLLQRPFSWWLTYFLEMVKEKSMSSHAVCTNLKYIFIRMSS